MEAAVQQVRDTTPEQPVQRHPPDAPCGRGCEVSDLLDLLHALYVSDQQATARATRLPQQFAAKWLAESRHTEPTDEALAEAFKDCARAPRAEWYPAIRAEIGGVR